MLWRVIIYNIGVEKETTSNLNFYQANETKSESEVSNLEKSEFVFLMTHLL